MYKRLPFLWTLACLLAAPLAAQRADFSALMDQVVNGAELDWDAVHSLEQTADLRLLRNAIYARHGYIFRSEDMKQYFRALNWYEPRLENVDALLTATDKENLHAILWAEADAALIAYLKQPASGKLKPNPEDTVLRGIWHSVNYMASGWSENFCLFPNGKILWRASQMDCEKRMVYFAGEWKRIGDRFEIVYTHELVKEGGYMVPSYGSCGSDSSLVEANPVFREMNAPHREYYYFTPVAPDLSDDREIPMLKLNAESWWKMGNDPFRWD